MVLALMLVVAALALMPGSLGTAVSQTAGGRPNDDGGVYVPPPPVRPPPPSVAPVVGDGPGKFAAVPVFGGPNLALSVWHGGSVEALSSALIVVGSSGAWAQAASGRYVVYVVGAAGWVNAEFFAAFPGGFEGDTALMLVGPVLWYGRSR